MGLWGEVIGADHPLFNLLQTDVYLIIYMRIFHLSLRTLCLLLRPFSLFCLEQYMLIILGKM